MGIEAIIGIIVGVLTIIGTLSAFIFKIIHKNIMDSVATMIDEKIEKYESETEKIREERQKRYAQTIENIEKSLIVISECMRTLHNDIVSYGNKVTIHETKITRIEADIEKMRV